ncbi:MAG TPA: hypothetical protein VJ916_00925 [Anaerovoracaceae bacterium]|nr:hypothetical protein [Anaerovoracaceae bacterium]
MDKDIYYEKMLEKLKYNFDINRNERIGKWEFEIAAKSHIRNEKYIGFKSAVIYAFENDEYIYGKHFHNVSKEDVKRFIELLKSTINSTVDPHEDHMSTTFTALITVDEPVDEETKDFIKKFKYQKSFLFGLKGWVVVRVVLVELSNEEVTGSKEAKKEKAFYLPQ